MSGGFVHGTGRLPKERSTMQEGMASLVRSISCSGALSAEAVVTGRLDGGGRSAATAYFWSLSDFACRRTSAEIMVLVSYDSARLSCCWCGYRRSECMRRNSQIRQARLRHAGRCRSIAALQALDPFERVFARKGSESEETPGGG